MSKNKIIAELMKEGFSYRTLSSFSEKQLKVLSEKVTYLPKGTDPEKAEDTANKMGGPVIVADEKDIETDVVGNPKVQIDNKDLLRDRKELDEKSVSKSQHGLMGAAYSVKKGEKKLLDIPKSYRSKVKEMVDTMSLKDLKDFAKTKEKGLPQKVDEMLESWVTNLVEREKSVVRKRDILSLAEQPQPTIAPPKTKPDPTTRPGKPFDRPKTTPKPKAKLFNSIEQEISYELLESFMSDMSGYVLRFVGKTPNEIKFNILGLNSDVWNTTVDSNGTIMVDGNVIISKSDLSEVLVSSMDGELHEQPQPTIAPPKTKPDPTTRPGKPFDRPKTIPKPKAGKSDVPTWFKFSSINNRKK
jgi:hypothetical protein